MYEAAAAAAILVVSVAVLGHKRVKPPPPKICAAVTSPRIKLSDGRHLSYKECGVPKEIAKFKVILVHGFDSSKDIYLPLSQEMIEELGVFILTFDRAGYGESDPNPTRSVKSEAFDIQQLADQLHLGPKFHVIGVSIGTYPIWACLNYLPHRLAGVTLVVPVINFWWPSFPTKLANEVFRKQLKRDQIKLSIAHHVPALVYWWMTQKLFPNCSIMQTHPILLNPRDFQTIKQLSQLPNPHQVRLDKTTIDRPRI
ncbi:uncharacterized protein LOC126656883 isoform X2 [Mercurialis annua]|uniref:uncharacterized protein LOC126656883 isoform X2 n=1 Tax=Mercurialis annua TaxID=3986 RepID=UPI002160F711|nr:uncharacterized protein LOC126656883 isoform X2 [Mercurialis annua]